MNAYTLFNSIKKRMTRIQIIPSNQDQVNAAKKAIQTLKNHFIAGLATVDKNFPM